MDEKLEGEANLWTHVELPDTDASFKLEVLEKIRRRRFRIAVVRHLGLASVVVLVAWALAVAW